MHGNDLAILDLQRRRATVEKPLHHLASGSLQQSRLLLGLDAFRTGVHAERTRQADNGGNNSTRA